MTIGCHLWRMTIPTGRDCSILPRPPFQVVHLVSICVKIHNVLCKITCSRLQLLSTRAVPLWGGLPRPFTLLMVSSAQRSKEADQFQRSFGCSAFHLSPASHDFMHLGKIFPPSGHALWVHPCSLAGQSKSLPGMWPLPCTSSIRGAIRELGTSRETK